MNNLYNFLDVTGTLHLMELAEGENVKVAVLDTGSNNDSDMISDKYSVLTRDDNVEDKANHGTVIIDIINTIAPKAEISVIKVLDDVGNGNMSTIYAGLNHAVKIGADIICLSIGGEKKLSTETRKTLNRLTKDGVIVVSAVGNGRCSKSAYPACYDNVIGVGGLSKNNVSRWHKSNKGDDVDLLALAEDIESSDGETYSGTSFANAIVVGQIALLLSIDEDMSREDILRHTQYDKRSASVAKGYLDINKYIDEAGLLEDEIEDRMNSDDENEFHERESLLDYDDFFEPLPQTDVEIYPKEEDDIG